MVLFCRSLSGDAARKCLIARHHVSCPGNVSWRSFFFEKKMQCTVPSLTELRLVPPPNWCEQRCHMRCGMKMDTFSTVFISYLAIFEEVRCIHSYISIPIPTQRAPHALLGFHPRRRTRRLRDTYRVIIFCLRDASGGVAQMVCELTTGNDVPSTGMPCRYSGADLTAVGGHCGLKYGRSSPSSRSSPGEPTSLCAASVFHVMETSVGL